MKSSSYKVIKKSPGRRWVRKSKSLESRRCKGLNFTEVRGMYLWKMAMQMMASTKSTLSTH
jgi:hypothetical protein